jgi:hypothetical protein
MGWVLRSGDFGENPRRFPHDSRFRVFSPACLGNPKKVRLDFL